MKTIILDSNNSVINVVAGEPNNSPPEGFTYMIIDDGVWVEPGCKLDENGNLYIPIEEN